MSAAGDILAAATREIGYREGKNKANKYGEWFGLNYVPWCMIFVQWVYAQAGIPLPYKTGSCGMLLNWYRTHAPDCIRKEPVPGCIVIFDFPDTGHATDHTGIFVSADGDRLRTVDGNTSGTNQSNGGWVQQKTRKLSYANPTYIVPRCLTEEKEETDMKETRYNTMAELSDGAPWAVETVAKLIESGAIRGSGMRDAQGRPADMDLSRDMLRLLVWNDRQGLYK